MATDSFDRDLRLFVYRHFLAKGEPPTVVQAAEALSGSQQDAETGFRRLEAGHVLVLAPGTLDIWMANPLCAVPTAFRVATASGSWWGTCIWDALGIPAMLGDDATITTSCADCGEPLELRVEGDALLPAEGVAHFAVPARRWWENIAYT
jgi:Alkylmercury lyase